MEIMLKFLSWPDHVLWPSENSLHIKWEIQDQKIIFKFTGLVHRLCSLSVRSPNFVHFNVFWAKQLCFLIVSSKYFPRFYFCSFLSGIRRFVCIPKIGCIEWLLCCNKQRGRPSSIPIYSLSLFPRKHLFFYYLAQYFNKLTSHN